MPQKHERVVGVAPSNLNGTDRPVVREPRRQRSAHSGNGPRSGSQVVHVQIGGVDARLGMAVQSVLDAVAQCGDTGALVRTEGAHFTGPDESEITADGVKERERLGPVRRIMDGASRFSELPVARSGDYSEVVHWSCVVAWRARWLVTLMRLPHRSCGSESGWLPAAFG
jgi:hypothetical protein